jgi:D-3-phosphoglycerate dehydrogenase / 2-oxoglutarate reductase
MKVYVLDRMHPGGVELLAQRAEVVRWDDARVGDWHADADGVVVRLSQVAADDLARAKRLKAVVKHGVGVDNIDLAAARDRGVVVCNTPGVNSDAVAELTLGLALAIARRVAECDRRLRADGTIDRAQFLGVELGGKHVGVIGMGNIGTRVARKFHAAFGARILAYDPYVPADHWPDIPHERLASLDEMWPRADVVTPHVPLTAETRGIIGRAGLARMKPTAIVVNAARGGVVDEQALYDALKAGKIFGAGLDVFEAEPPTTRDPLLGLPNVVATPHAGGGTLETQAKSSLAAAETLLAVLDGNIAAKARVA